MQKEFNSDEQVTSILRYGLIGTVFGIAPLVAGLIILRQSDMDIVAVRINAIIKRAFEIFSQQLKVRGIDVLWELAPNLPPIEADPSCLEQVFVNLLVNARDAIESAWERVPPEALTDPAEQPVKQIIIRTRRQDDQVIAEVEDSGDGIPEAIREKIFEPFFTTKEVGKGTGLGLSISYSIVKDCRGSIRADSLPGKGARFTVVFPAVGPEDAGSLFVEAGD